MSEQSMRSIVVKALSRYHAVPVENPAFPGTPDVNLTLGWIELKELDEWPREGGKVKVPHFTPQQKVWLLKRWNANRGAWLLLKVKNTWLLFSGYKAVHLLGSSSRTLLEAACLKCWNSAKDMKEQLCSYLLPV